ncbi:MAG: hypothetical protein QOE35_1795 [Actinomycetota bacterium]
MTSVQGTGRLPDFVVIGAAKSGTTTLYRWLAEQPDVFDAPLKEPRFFSRDWDRGIDWYAGLYATASPDELVGDASTNYTDPAFSDVAAARMRDALPNARLVYLLRHPVERLQSQYRHDRRRAVVKTSLAQAVREPGNPYVGRSLYWSNLRPYADRFDRDQIRVARFEDLVGNGAPAWHTILRHLGLTDRPPPSEAYNVTSEKRRVSRPLAMLRDRGLLERVPTLPVPVARRLKRALRPRQKGDGGAEGLEAIPQDVIELIRADSAELEAWLGLDRPLWDAGGGADPSDR